MSDKEYGLEDVCVALDSIENQLKILNGLLERYIKDRESQ